MRKGIYMLILLCSAACTQSEDVKTDPIEDLPEVKEEKLQGEVPMRAKRDSIHADVNPETPDQMAKYTATFSGSWFQIDYPADFTASPISPTNVYGDYQFVETDEATFTSPDGTVEFFIFSPQWGGDPIDYLTQGPSEKTVKSREEKFTEDDPFEVTHTWGTFEHLESKYTRAYHSIKTESTHHVFGVKYHNRKMYERYKAAYMAFKKSLQQFAD